jgi:hypothetical protein
VSVTAIKPIETEYNGYRFRSRLEARWAVFFGAVGLRYEYEKEGFILPSGRYYLPDFWLPDLQNWCEIKPLPETKYPDDVWMTDGSLEAEFFAPADVDELDDPGCKPGGGASGFVIFGTPGVPEAEYGRGGSYVCATFGDSPYYWCECECGALGVQFDGRSARNKHKPGCKAMTGDKGYAANTPRLRRAFEAARSARFEHGEKPQVTRWSR